MYNLSKSSLDKLATCKEPLRELAKEAIKDSPYDFKITHGQRTPTEQFNLYLKGRTRMSNGTYIIVNKDEVVTHKDGYNSKSKHNTDPLSEAFDFCVLVNGQVTWDVKYYIEVAHHILEVAKKLNIPIRWGADWDGDGDTKDERFKDYPHIELG